jgi:Family of unknown function (DUF5995)
MFAYGAELLASLGTPPATVADVLATMQTIDSLTGDGDGLKWFNWLYFQVTKAVEDRINAGGFADAAFLSLLDVQFAQLYFNALRGSLSGWGVPSCWQALFSRRNDTRLARIQCALSGINAHINHDLPIAIVNTARLSHLPPQHGTPQYNDYTTLNATLDSMIDEAKKTLNVRLLGEVLPPVNTMEDTVAGWSVSAAREAAWNNSELLWHLQDQSLLSNAFLNTLDGLTTVVSKGLLVPIPSEPTGSR